MRFIKTREDYLTEERLKDNDNMVVHKIKTFKTPEGTFSF